MGFRTLMANTDPTYFRLVPDVGWVTRGGADPVKFLEEFKDRIEVLHFKEFTAENSFTCLLYTSSSRARIIIPTPFRPA